MHRPDDDGTLSYLGRRLPLAAVAFVVVALLGLAVAPIAILRELDGMRARTAATSDRAQSIITELRLFLAEDVDYHQGVRLHQAGSAARYREVRRHEDAVLDTLDTVTDPIGQRLGKQVDSLRELAARWHRMPDAYVDGRVDDADFEAALPAVTALHDSTLVALQNVETSVEVARNRDQVQGGRTLERQRLISLTVGLLALLGTGVVFWFARRDRVLNRQLARALAEEAQARDETEKRRVELERVTESKSRLMRGFSHDVKNPIGAADGYLQLLQDGLMDPLTPRQAASISRARRSLEQAQRLIEDLLELARADSGRLDVQRVPVNLSEIAHDATEEFRAQAEQKGLSIACDHGGDGVVVESDPVRVRQVLSNLVSNAVKYTDRGSVMVRVRSEGHRGVIEVADTGRGIPSDAQSHVFQEFVRLDPRAAPGAGVGLAISQKIVQTLGGEITVTSEVGRGSQFVLALPVQTITRTHPSGTESSVTAPL